MQSYVTLLTLLLIQLSFAASAATPKPKIKEFTEPTWVTMTPKHMNRKLMEMVASAEKCSELKKDYDRWEGEFHEASDARETALVQWFNTHPGVKDAQAERDDVDSREIYKRYHELASTFESTKKSLLACLKNEIAGRIVYTFPIHLEPKEKSRKLGNLEITLDLKTVTYAKLGFYFSPTKGERKKFVLDMNIPCEYDGLYHTVLAKQGRWLLLPKMPFQKPVWIQFSEDWGPIEMASLKNLEVINLKVNDKYDDYLVQKIQDGHVQLVPYIRETSTAAEQIEEEPLKVPFKSLYDSHRHLKVTKTYIDGC